MTESTAYAMGRNSVWYEQGPNCPITDRKLRKAWLDGRRDALAEVRLDNDTEWDND